MIKPSFIAAMLVSRQVYEALDGHLNNLDPVNQVIVSAIDAYYKRDPSTTYVDVDVLEALICSQISSVKHKDEISATISVLRDVAPNVSDVNVRELARNWKRESMGKDIATRLASSNHGDVVSLMERYMSYVLDEDQEERLTFDDIFGELEDPASAMPIGPPALNTMLEGGIRGGDHICIFGRPNSGKSLFAIDTSCRLAKLGKRGIYLENEDRIKRTTRRFWTNLTGMTKEQILADKRGARKLAEENGVENLMIRDITPGTVGQITGFVRQFKPDFIVVNQVRNLAIGQVSSMVEKLERAGIAMRNLAKRENIGVISVTQAGDSASNKRVLEQSDIDNSRTGFPAQVDVLIGVGMTQEDDENNTRCISLSKNKLGGDNGYIMVKIDKQLSTVC